MKFRYLKSLIPAALSLSLTFGMVSCVGAVSYTHLTLPTKA